MNKNYQRGTRFERIIIQTVEKLGYSTLRTAGSHGFADVVAVNRNLVRFIQSKVTKDKKIRISTYKLDIAKILETSIPENVTKELWIKRDREQVYKILIL